MEIILTIFGVGLAMIVLERLKPNVQLPAVKGWMTRVVLLNGCQLAFVFIAGWTWDAWLEGVSLLHIGDALPAPVGGLIGYLVSTFVYYWWHRGRHSSRWLWRLFHQVHHSPQRIEVMTSFYKHPLEIAANGILTSLIVYAFLGLSVEAAAFNTLFSALSEFFYHLNCRTPRWVGYFIQRPEMHRIHHEHGVHRSNYADLPIWDMLFGTYHNPTREEGEVLCGFDPDKELSLGKMLTFGDVHADEPMAPRARPVVIKEVGHENG